MKIYTPKDAELNSKGIPDFVFDAFNDLLAKKWNGGKEIIITQDKAVEAILDKYRSKYDMEILRSTIFDEHWLDIESAYEKAGWKVEFDKPAYCESYKARFIFTPKTD